MRRRRYLAIAGTAVTTALAGCSEDDDGRDEFRADLADRLETGMVTIQSLEWDEDVLALEYSTEAEIEEDLVDDVAVIGGSVAGIYDEHDVEIERFDAIAYDQDGDRFGTFWIDPEWAEQFKSDEISDVEYVEVIAETIEVA